MATQDMGFNVFALDKASKTFEQMSQRVEKMSNKMDELDRKRAEPEVDVDVDKSMDRVSRLSGLMSEGLSGSMRVASTSAYTMGAAIVAALGSAPAAAASASAGMVGAMGGGLAAIGVKAAAESDRVQREFDELTSHVQQKMSEISVPFEETLVDISDQAKRTFDEFAPALRRSFDEMAPQLSVFSDQFFQALEGLKPAIEPVTEAFNSLLRQIGPRLGPLFEDIGKQISNVARAVEDNAPQISRMIGMFAQLAPVALRVTARLTDLFGNMMDAMPRMAGVMLRGTQSIMRGLRTMSGVALDAFGLIVEGAANSLSWVPGVGPKLKKARDQFRRFRDSVDAQFNQAIGKVGQWATTLENMPKVMRLRGNIRDLRGKVDAARAKLDTVPPSKRSDIRARIDQLQTRIRVAKNEIASVQDRKVVDFVGRISREIVNPTSGFGLRPSFMAEGGRARRGQPHIVGEEGPELFVPGQSGTVVPNDAASRGGAMGGPVTVRIEVAGPDEMKKLLRSIVRKDGQGNVQTAFGQS